MKNGIGAIDNTHTIDVWLASKKEGLVVQVSVFTYTTKALVVVEI
tara:strand:+ start:304 stop:438 length:135 start_codon:yes stop_codon:yes gene_type:complete